MSLQPIAENLPWTRAAPVALDRDGPCNTPFQPFAPDWVDRPALELFAGVVARHPDRIASEDVDTRLTFAELWAAARRLAASIDGVAAAGAPVGVLLPNQASYPVAVLACLGAARPCVLIDRNYPEERVGRIVRDAGLSAIVLRRSDIAEGYLLPAGVRPIEIEAALEGASAPATMPAPAAPSDAPSFVVYTSGSTGSPKGIVLSQRGVLHRAAELVNAVHLHAGDKVLSLASPGTIGGLQQIFEVMLAGATLVKLDLQLLGLGQILRMIAERRITMMFSTPAVWRSISRLQGVREMLASLRCIQSSGDTLLLVDYQLVRSALPPGCHMLSVYGATEAPALLQWFVASPPADEASVPAGYPLPDLDLAVLDETGQPVADGAPGELVIRSRFASLGLWQSGAVAPGTLQPDPVSPELKIYRTGDVVRRRSDGLYIMIGRRDRQIKILGNRVELAEVETALRRAPGVLDAAVVARRGDGEALLLGFVVPQQQGDPEVLNVVRRHLESVLPNYMRPRNLIMLDSLPLLPGRKVDEEALLVQARSGIDQSADPAMAVDRRPSRQATELVTKAWHAATGRRRPERATSFEEAGGDSLQLLRLIFELEQLTGRPLPLERFHGRLTPQQFAVELDGCLNQAAEVLMPDRPAIFLFPPSGGGDAYLTAFRAACVARVALRQVRYPDLRALAQDDASFERVAAYAVSQIETLKPDGFLVLAGYSQGGDVAYEATRQLRAKGRHVVRLLILDADASGVSYPAPLAEAKPMYARLRRLLLLRPTTRHYRKLIETLVPDRLLHTAPARAILRLVLALAPHLPLSGGAAFIAFLKIYDVLLGEHHRRWSVDLKPQQLDVPIVLFRSDEDRPGAPPDLGWASRTCELSIVPTPGDHSTMLAAECGLALAATLARMAR